ncbi:hypothetical protein [Aquisphaera insulae]|uniref:hypothetical protein n=1 Tax=Aquisphaera insulae TaxID=2712864 RepID=UPI0013ED24E3|nr:hypothetical protein [Aquisphaera insulae]
MHFWNKLSTAALMRLSVLASLNVVMLRIVGGWDILLHPWFFLSMVTLNLGLYSVMVYSGTLNKTLIGMMLGGSIALLGTLLYTGIDASAFAYGGPFRRLGSFVMESVVNPRLQSLPKTTYAGGPITLRFDQVALLGNSLIDALGLVAIVAGGLVGRFAQARFAVRGSPQAAPEGGPRSRVPGP